MDLSVLQTCGLRRERRGDPVLSDAMTLSGHPDGSNRARASTFARRFWSLLVTVLVLAVCGSALAVRFTATPFLEEHQNMCVADQAEKDARNPAAILARNRMLIYLVGASTEVINVAMGYVEPADLVIEYLDTVPLVAAVTHFRVTDIFGETLCVHHLTDAEERPFSADEVSSLAAAVAGDVPGAVRRVLLRVEGQVAHMEIATPSRTDRLRKAWS